MRVRWTDFISGCGNENKRYKHANGIESVTVGGESNCKKGTITIGTHKAPGNRMSKNNVIVKGATECAWGGKIMKKGQIVALNRTR